MAKRIQLRRGTAAEWALADPVLAHGEPGWVTDARVLKIGDGSSPFSELASGIDAGGSSLFQIAEVADATLTPVQRRQYLATNDLELLAPPTPAGSYLWETRVYLRAGATLSFPADWKIGGNPSGAGANLARIFHLDGAWHLEWETAFEMMAGTRLYVNQTGGHDGNDGYSWDEALATLQQALVLARAQAATEIWVAQGTYNAGTAAGYEIPAGVTVYGGFLGNESFLAQRGVTAAPENGYGAVTYAYETVLTNTIIALPTARQAVYGLRTTTGVPTVHGCTIASSPRGVYTDVQDGIECVDCIIRDNAAPNSTGDGGGASMAVLRNCTLVNNSTSNTNGGGASFCTAHNCLFRLNFVSTSNYYGGGMNGGTAYNCWFDQNTARLGGGMSGVTAQSCLLTNNVAANQGAAANSGTMYNCIAHSNTGANTVQGGTVAWCKIVGIGTLSVCASSVAVFSVLANGTSANTNGATRGNTLLHIGTHSTGSTGSKRNNLEHNCGTITWQGTVSNNMVSAGNADFVAPAAVATVGPTTDAGEIASILAAVLADGYDLAPGSSAIDQGDPVNPQTTVAQIDILGRPRIVGSAPDCGAYEYQG